MFCKHVQCTLFKWKQSQIQIILSNILANTTIYSLREILIHHLSLSLLRPLLELLRILILEVKLLKCCNSLDIGVVWVILTVTRLVLELKWNLSSRKLRHEMILIIHSLRRLVDLLYLLLLLLLRRRRELWRYLDIRPWIAVRRHRLEISLLEWLLLLLLLLWWRWLVLLLL